MGILNNEQINLIIHDLYEKRSSPPTDKEIILATEKFITDNDTRVLTYLLLYLKRNFSRVHEAAIENLKVRFGKKLISVMLESGGLD